MSLGFNVIVISKIGKGFQENIHVNGTTKKQTNKQSETKQTNNKKPRVQKQDKI